MKYIAIYKPGEGTFVHNASDILEVGDLVEVRTQHPEEYLGSFVVARRGISPRRGIVPSPGHSACRMCAFLDRNCLIVTLASGEQVCATPHGCVMIPVENILEDL